MFPKGRVLKRNYHKGKKTPSVFERFVCAGGNEVMVMFVGRFMPPGM